MWCLTLTSERRPYTNHIKLETKIKIKCQIFTAEQRPYTNHFNFKTKNCRRTAKRRNSYKIVAANVNSAKSMNSKENRAKTKLRELSTLYYLLMFSLKAHRPRRKHISKVQPSGIAEISFRKIIIIFKLKLKNYSQRVVVQPDLE